MSSTRPGRSANGRPWAGRTWSRRAMAATRCRAATNSASESGLGGHARDVGRDGGQHVVAGQQRRRRPGRTGRCGPRCGRACGPPASPADPGARPPGRRPGPSGVSDSRPCLDRSSQVRMASSSPAPGRKPSSPHGVDRGWKCGIGPVAVQHPGQAGVVRALEPGRRRGRPVVRSSVDELQRAAGRPSHAAASNGVENARWATTSQWCSTLSRPAPPKWSGCEWVTTTVWIRSAGMPIGGEPLHQRGVRGRVGQAGVDQRDAPLVLEHVAVHVARARAG